MGHRTPFAASGWAGEDPQAEREETCRERTGAKRMSSRGPPLRKERRAAASAAVHQVRDAQDILGTPGDHPSETLSGPCLQSEWVVHDAVLYDSQPFVGRLTDSVTTTRGPERGLTGGMIPCASSRDIRQCYLCFCHLWHTARKLEGAWDDEAERVRRFNQTRYRR